MRQKIFFIFLIFFSFLFVVKASAFSITPSKILITIDSGAEQNFSIKIKNEEKQDLNYKIKVVGARQDNQGSPLFREKIDVAETWVKPEQDSVLIKSGETKSLNISIKAPKGIDAGSRYLGLLVEPIFSSGSQASISGQVVALLTLQVSGLVNESVKITKWETKKDLINNRDWQFNLGLENNGTIEVDLSGSLIVKDWRGNEMYQEKIKLGNKLIAQSIRSLESKTSLSKKNLYLPGLYQVQIKINYGKTNQTVSALTYIWYLPNWLWGVGVGVVLILIGLIVVIKVLKWGRDNSF
jgi:hypothetical protein